MYFLLTFVKTFKQFQEVRKTVEEMLKSRGKECCF